MICCICDCDKDDYILVLGKCICEECEQKIVTGHLCAAEYSKFSAAMRPIFGYQKHSE